MNSLLRRIKSGDEKALKVLFDQEYANLVRFSYQYLFDEKACEDVVQEAFLFIWEKADKIEIESSFKSYLYTLVRNRCLNILKSVHISKRCNIYEIGIDMHQEEEASEGEVPLRGKKILEAVEALPEKMKQIVKLRFLQNYRYKEIAEELGLSVNTVKTQLKRAKLKLQENLLLTSFLLIKLLSVLLP